MKAIAIVDIHFSLDKLETLRERFIQENIGLILVLGDLTNLGGKEECEEVLRLLDFAPVLAIPGNLDTHEVLSLLEEHGISLHAKKRKLGGFTLIGFGGGINPLKAETTVFSEEEIEKGLKKLFKGEKNVILLTHLPPKDTKLDLSKNGIHVGSESIRKIIEENNPLLCLCGHCHEGKDEDFVRTSKCINIGALKDGHALLLEINSGIKVDRIELK